MEADVKQENTGLTDDVRQFVRAVRVAANVGHKRYLTAGNRLDGILSRRGDCRRQGGMCNLNHTTRINLLIVQLII